MGSIGSPSPSSPFVTLQRLAELVHAPPQHRAADGAGRLRGGGGPLSADGRDARRWIVGLWWLAPRQPVVPLWLAVFFVAQGLRLWVLATLKERWTTRIIVLPGEPLVRRGPYRFLSHPNYVVVAIELAALPLAFGLVGFAALFTVLNALVLAIRIRAETPP